MRAKALAVPILLVIASLAVALILGESTSRTCCAEQMTLFPRYHSRVQYGDYILRRFRPNTEFWHTSVDGHWRFVTNTQGYRSEHDYVADKASGKFRVLVLGDSHGAGFEVQQDESFAAALERDLQARGFDAEVFNSSVSGFGTADQLVFLRESGLSYRPNAIVLAFYANDSEDIVGREDRILASEELFHGHEGEALQVPHGHRHINAPARSIIAARLADVVVLLSSQSPALR